ncbi:MAG: aminopeptidase P family protein [archaeon]|nr:aminopeptidase P family protein [archaeon]
MISSKIENIQKRMEKDDFQGYLLADFANINYLSKYLPSSFAFCVIKEGPIIYCSQMDMELASKNSTIQYVQFENFSKLIDDLKEEGIKNLAIEPSLPFETFSKFKEDFKIDSVDYVNKERMIKTSEEISNITKATKIAQDSFLELDFTSGANEKALSYELGRLMRQKGAFSESFDTILTSGSNSSLPHAIPENKQLEKPILVDWGAIYNGYCSDNTRTIVYSEREYEIFNIVKEAHDESIKVIKPGLKCCEIDKVARDIIKEYGYGDLFIHSLGHSVGLDIHETPNFSPKDESIIEKGMVITVEPGIYFEDEFGVRLEDTVEIQKSAKIIGDLPLELNIDL